MPNLYLVSHNAVKEARQDISIVATNKQILLDNVDRPCTPHKSISFT